MLTKNFWIVVTLVLAVLVLFIGLRGQNTREMFIGWVVSDPLGHAIASVKSNVVENFPLKSIGGGLGLNLDKTINEIDFTFRIDKLVNEDEARKLTLQLFPFIIKEMEKSEIFKSRFPDSTIDESSVTVSIFVNEIEKPQDQLPYIVSFGVFKRKVDYAYKDPLKEYSYFHVKETFDEAFEKLKSDQSE